MTEENKTYTQEEYDQLKNETAKGKEILEGRYELLIANKDSYLADPNKIAEIEDKRTQKFILEKLYDGKSLDEIVTDDKKEEPNIDDLVAQSMAKAKVQEKIDSVVQKLPEDKREAFLAEFGEISDGKNLTPKNVAKYMKFALNEVLPDDGELDVKSIKAQAFGSNTSAKRKSASTKKQEERINFARSLRR